MSNAYGRLLARAGAVLFAISLINGFLAHALRNQGQAIAAHLIGLIGAAFLILLGLLWSHLAQTSRMSKVGVFLALYGFCGGWLVNFLAAATGNFGIFPISVGISHGTPTGDLFISAGLLSVAIADLALSVVVFLGLRQSRM